MTLRRDQVLFTLAEQAFALLVPHELTRAITTILPRRGHGFPVLSHPAVPDHRILLAGQRAGIALSWPDQTRPITGPVLLPPTGTPAGPMSWSHLPPGHRAETCREIDLHHAVHTALHDDPELDHP